MRILDELREADQAAGLLQTTVSGTLRLFAGTHMVPFVSPVIVEFLRRHPEASVDLNTGERTIDMVEEGFDLAIRASQPLDSSVIVRRLADWHHILCAAPSYIEKHGAPQRLEDLKQHNCLRYSLYPFGDEWQFIGPGEAQMSVKVSGSLMTNSAPTIRAVALDGQGIVLAPTFIGAEDLRAGRLVRLLPDHRAIDFVINGQLPDAPSPLDQGAHLPRSRGGALRRAPHRARLGFRPRRPDTSPEYTGMRLVIDRGDRYSRDWDTHADIPAPRCRRACFDHHRLERLGALPVARTRDEGGAKLYYGEFEENLREASPGLLDRLTPLPEAKAGATALKVEKTAGAFALSGKAAPGDSIVAEQVRITERKQGEKVTRTLGRLAARTIPDWSERAATLALDVLPAGKPGAIRVVYDGKPVAKAKLEVIAESGWKREYQADEQGAVQVALPWRGAYVIEVQHLDATAGAQGAEAYETRRLVTTLSFRVADGTQGPAAPPPAKPH